jgi:hypothetical protein
MKTVIKLIVVLLILNASYRVGSAYWTHYQLQDSIQQMAQFSEHAAPEELKTKILEQAAALAVPIDAENLTVVRGNRRIDVDGTYFRDIEIVPRFKRHWDFTIHVTVVTLS